MPWPMPDNLGGQVSFSTFVEWRSFVLALSPRRVIPEIVTRKFERAQKLHVLVWLDVDLIKAGELIALTGFVRVTAGRLRMAQHAQTEAATSPRGRATRPTRRLVFVCKLRG